MRKKAFESLAPGFLLATPSLQDPNFRRAVVLLFHHTPDGALGLVVNRPSKRNLGELLDLIEVKPDPPAVAMRDLPVLVGGPVSPGSGWLIFEGKDPEGMSFKVQDDLRVTGSMDVFRMMLERGPPGGVAFLLGYAGWGPGQLDHEMEAGAWMAAPVEREALFEWPYEDRWRRAFLSLGIDPNFWTPMTGEG